MKRLPSHGYAAIVALGFALLPGPQAFASGAQEEGSPTAVLLSRARTLEGRGRLDLARQDWSQVLLLEPNDAEALAGLVRAARAEGREADAKQYLDRLRATHPKGPELLRLENSGKGHDASAEIAEADRLARSGDNQGAFALYKRVYGLTPPPGAPALAYYQAEAATEEGRPQAIAGLRALGDRYPSDARYPVTLGRVLLASARTRAEGRTLLERYPGNPEAVAALRGSGVAGDAAANFSSPSAKRPDTVAATRTAEAPAKPVPKPAPGTPISPSVVAQRPSAAAEAPHTVPGTTRPETTAAVGVMTRPALRTVSTGGTAPRHGAFLSQEQAGFAALNGHRMSDAEGIFREILNGDPTNPRALAGLGYVRQSAGNLKEAVTLFERAQENGDRSLALTRTLVNAQYDLALQGASAARSRGDLAGAETQLREATRERPSDPEALEQLGTVLLQAGRSEEAIPVFTRLTQVRPMSPTAWRGLVISQASAGKAAGALATDSRVPAEVKTPLQGDPSYQQALATARNGAGTQVARVEPPPAIQPPSSPPPAKPAAAPPVVHPDRPPATPVPRTTTPAPSSRPSTPVANGAAPESSSTSAKPASPAATNPATPTAPARPAQRPASHPKTAPPAVPSAAPPKPVAPPPAPVPPARSEDSLAGERTADGEMALSHGENARAADLFLDAVKRQPERPNAWKGLIQSLHAGGHNGEAIAALAQVPLVPRAVLDRDATFQVTVGEAYLGAERPSEALHAYARAQTVFASQKLPPPLELVLRITALLASRHDDANLYRELAYLDDRRDLTDVQRREVQMIWTGWAVRHARALAAAGDQQRAVAVLNAAAEAFAGNPNVISAVADGYAGVGLPKEAVALYKARDLSNAPAHDLVSAIGVGIAARDYRTAEGWARAGRERFPSDPEMLTVSAELAQARGHEARAIELSRQAKALAPAQDPGQVLTAELREAGAGHGWRSAPAGQLSVLLSPGDAAGPSAISQGARPFLPTPAEPAGTQSNTAEIPSLPGYDEPSR